MTNQYQLYGYELSPYSIKVRSYMRYKGFPHQWIVRSLDKMEDFKKLAKIPIVPLVVTPENQVLQDSTPIIEALEAQQEGNSVTPDDHTLAFISYLLEEFGDEWGNKPMFHYRWYRETDQESAALRLAKEQLGPNAEEEALTSFQDNMKQRMIDRLWFVGSSDITADYIEKRFIDLLEDLEVHLQNRSYLMGERPCFGDFGLFAQLYECYTDPTPGTIIKERYPATTHWIERMLHPEANGDFERWSSLSDTLFPIIKNHIGQYFLPWSMANAKAIMENREEFSVQLDDFEFQQKPQKYHAKSLAKLRDRYQSYRDENELNQLLDATGCLTFLI